MAALGPIIVLLALTLAAAAVPGEVWAVGGGRLDLLVPPHLSWQHDPQRSITVAWATRARENGSYVRYGRSPALELPEKRANTTVLIRGYQGFRHAAEFRDLSPNSTYYYSVGSDNLGWSDTYTFTTAPADDPPFTFLAFADMGTTPEAVAAVQAMASQNYTFSIHAGDISYAGGNQAKWNQFFHEISPMASRHPYMTALGNHENETREKLVSYTARFSMPPLANPLDPSRSGLYYSFNFSMVHFVALKTDDKGGEYALVPDWDPIQTDWLRHDLEAASLDPTHPWTVVYFHYPTFSSGSSHGSWLVGRQVWGPLFDRYHVALVITGHDHDYERSYPVWSNGTVASRVPEGTYDHPPAPVYVVTGGGGETHYDFGRIQPWSAVHSQAFEFMEVTVEKGTMGIRTINSQDGSLVDCFQIVRGGPAMNVGDFCRGIQVPPRPGGMTPLWAGAAAVGLGVLGVTVALTAGRRRGSARR